MEKIKISSKGFTLLELLVVVLIIGILAGIALPQYKRVIERVHAMEAVQTIKAASDAIERYYLINGNYPAEVLNWDWIEDLDIDIPRTSKHFKYWRGSNYIGMYKGKSHSSHSYMISKVFDHDSYYYRRGLTCNVGLGYENSFYADICKDLCQTTTLTKVWGSGEKGCKIKF